MSTRLLPVFPFWLDKLWLLVHFCSVRSHFFQRELAGEACALRRALIKRLAIVARMCHYPLLAIAKGNEGHPVKDSFPCKGLQ